jgi:hypothetical protein
MRQVSCSRRHATPALNAQEGDPVKTGDVLAESGTDKANMEMEALGKGPGRRPTASTARPVHACGLKPTSE